MHQEAGEMQAVSFVGGLCEWAAFKENCIPVRQWQRFQGGLPGLLPNCKSRDFQSLDFQRL